jgi:hypothetical protein
LNRYVRFRQTVKTFCRTLYPRISAQKTEPRDLPSRQAPLRGHPWLLARRSSGVLNGIRQVNCGVGESRHAGRGRERLHREALEYSGKGELRSERWQGASRASRGSPASTACWGGRGQERFSAKPCNQGDGVNCGVGESRHAGRGQERL